MFFLSRVLPDKVGLDTVAGKLKKFNIHALLIIGGFEVNSSIIQTLKAKLLQIIAGTLFFV